MESNDQKNGTNRRRFLASIASGAAAVSLATIPSIDLHAENHFTPAPADDPDAWFNKIKGKHRIVFDVTEPHEIFPFAWPYIFLATNAATGTGDKDCNVVVVLRHHAMAYALDSSVWGKYKLGEICKADDPKTNAPATRNPFWKPQKGDFAVPGVGEVQIGINELQARGVMFCVCNMAITVYSAVAAGGMKMKPEDAYKEWKAAVLPGIQIVPSGVWAVGRAQEHGSQYCFVG